MTAHFGKKSIRRMAGGKQRRVGVHRVQGAVRRVELLVPETRSPSFAAEVRRQVRRLARSEQECREMDFIEAVQADNPLE